MKNTRRARERNLIGQRVRDARLRLKPTVSQDDLAGRMAAKGVFVDRTAISRIELKDRYVMDFEAKALAKCLGVSVAWLFGENQ
jgi:transcriptional regulator with XRE-family HTH domain